MNVYIFDNQEDLPLSHPLVQSIATQVVSLEGKRYDEVAIHFVDEKRICELHEDFFDDPTPTDCISFPIDEGDEPGYRVLGDVFVCPNVAIQYAKEHGGDPYEETTLYVIHGLLHLMGYDDIEEKDRLKIREAEKRHIEALKQKQLVLACS